MKVAVSVNSEGKVVSHLGKAKLFNIFSKKGDIIEFIETRMSDGNHQNHIIEDIKDCNVVISGGIGEGMINSLEDLGIEAIVQTEEDNPSKAVEKC